MKTESKSKIFITYAYTVKYPDPIYPRDSVNFNRLLIHNIGLDTFFVKNKSYIDEIKIYDASFFENEKDVGNFWGRHENPYSDSVQIYVIEQIPNTDSLIFRKVNRDFIGIL